VIELEIMLVFLAAIFFTLLYLLSERIEYGILTFICWQTTALMWLFISPMSSGYTVAFIWQAVALIFLVLIMLQLLSRLGVITFGDPDAKEEWES
jgi:hypothetical protein